MDTDSFVIYIKTEDFYEDIANDVERWFDTSNYDKNDNRPFLIGINKKGWIRWKNHGIILFTQSKSICIFKGW